MPGIPDRRLVELRAIVAFTQWLSFRDRRWAYLDYAKAQMNFWRDRWTYNAGKLASTK